MSLLLRSNEERGTCAVGCALWRHSVWPAASLTVTAYALDLRHRPVCLSSICHLLYCNYSSFCLVNQ